MGNPVHGWAAQAPYAAVAGHRRNRFAHTAAATRRLACSGLHRGCFPACLRACSTLGGALARRFLPERADGAPGDQADRFEPAAPEAVAEVTYGLQTRADGLQTRAAPRDGDPGAGPSGGADGARPGGFQNTREWEAAKLRDDVERLPDVRARSRLIMRPFAC